MLSSQITAEKTRYAFRWLGESYPHEVRRALLVSADRDVQVAGIPHLKARQASEAFNHASR
jgi:hypothetical protein